MNCLLRKQILMATACFAILAPSGLFSAEYDEIDQILHQTPQQLNLKSGAARGVVLALEGSQLRIKLGSVEYFVEVDQLNETPESYMQRARSLLADGKYRRTAVLYGMARLLDPSVADMDIEEEIIGGLEHEKTETRQFRENRIRTEKKEFESTAMANVRKSFPELQPFLRAETLPLPRHKPAPQSVLDQWESATIRNGDAWQRLRNLRESTESPDQRLNDAQTLVDSLPPVAESLRDVKVDLKRLDSIINLFVRADAGLLMDHLLHEKTKTEFETYQATYTAPIDRLRNRARENLLEQLVPSKKVVRVKQGNLFKDSVVPVERNMKLLDEMKGRHEAPFVQERRADSGMYFTTSEGDEVFVPVEDWSEFDNPPQMAATVALEFQKKERKGLALFREGARGLVLAWGADQNDIDLVLALQILKNDALAIYKGIQIAAPATSGADSQPVPTSDPTSAAIE